MTGARWRGTLESCPLDYIMGFRRTIFFIGLLGIALFTADFVSAREDFSQLSSRLNLEESSEVSVFNDGSGGVSITNDISISANSGGQNISGDDAAQIGRPSTSIGKDAGSITGGSAKAEVRVKTEVNGEVVEDVYDSYEGEADVEKEFENTSGTVRTKIKVEVHSGTSSVATSTSDEDENSGEETRIKEKGSWFSKFWPFWGDKDDDTDDTDDVDTRDTFATTSSPDVLVEATSADTAIAGREEFGRNIQEAIRDFLKNIFSIFRR